MLDPQVPPTDAPIVLPYLPDPAVNGIALVNLPGAQPEQLGEIVGGVLRYRSPYVDVLGYLGKSVTQIPVLEAHQWPDAVPFRLRLLEGDRPPEWDDQRRLLIVYLPKAIGPGIAQYLWRY